MRASSVLTLANPGLHDLAIAPALAGLKSACYHNRNLEDRHAKAIAQRDGIIGVAFFPEAVCGSKLGDIIRSFQVAVNLTSVNNVVLGSDYDGAGLHCLFLFSTGL